MVTDDSSAATPCGKPTYTAADLSIRHDFANDQVVVELADHDGDGFILRIEPGPALELALRLAAVVARLRRIET
jgi:hypothetical protein